MRILIASTICAMALAAVSTHAFALAGLNGTGLNLASLNGSFTTTPTPQVNLQALQIESIELANC